MKGGWARSGNNIRQGSFLNRRHRGHGALGFHRFYAKILLRSTLRQLLRGHGVGGNDMVESEVRDQTTFLALKMVLPLSPETLPPADPNNTTSFISKALRDRHPP